MKITDERLDEITGFGQKYRLKTDEKIQMAHELRAARLVARAAGRVLTDYELGLQAAKSEGILEEETFEQGGDLAKNLRDALEVLADAMGESKKEKKT